MDRHEGQTSSARPSLKRKLEPEFQDQNEARKILVVQDPNKDVQSNSTTTSTSFSRPHWNYDVFLSFRGEDIRKKFIDHLYTALVRVGIRTFRDDKELRGGKTISTELLNAICGSKISIVVFSKGYASSRWCLDELVQIMHCRNTIGHTLLPIFYHVDPSDVREQTKTFAEAFARHEEQLQTNMERVQRWRLALTEAANCSGWNLGSLANGYESSFIEKIVAQVSCEVEPIGLNVARHPVGINYRVDQGSEVVEGLTLNLPIHEGVDLKTEAFAKMKNLRLLEINAASLTGCYKHLSKELRWLCWHKCPLEFLPPNFHLENLVVLDMQHSNVKQVWNEENIFNNLKVLNLSNSKCLTKSPDFSQVLQLEILILEGCTNLVQVHDSIGYLKRLVLVNLKNCINLKDLPRSILKLESLETLDLSGCSALEKLPEQWGNMIDLTKLHMDVIAIKQLPSSCGFLKNLKTVSLFGCNHLTELPNFLPFPHLERLVLEGCTSLVEIHESIGLLKRLRLLDLQRCENLRNLPNNISNLLSLETLDLSKCFNLEKLPEQLGNMTALSELYVENTIIKQLPSSFSLLKNLETLSLRGCECLIESPEFLQTSRLETLILEDCTSLVEVHNSIGLLKRLVCLSLGGCKKLKNLPSSISNLELLETLVLSDCLELDKLPEQLGNMMALKELLADRTAIDQLPSSFGLLRNLRIVLLSGCGGLSSSWISHKSSNCINLLVSISGLCSLTKLDLSDRNLSEDEIPIELGCLSSLRELVLSRNNFRNLPNCINYLPGLSDLFLNECTTLQSISLPISVQLLVANGCTSLERILILTNESSGSFYLNNCHKLVEIQSLKSLQSASNVLMGGCNNLAYDFRKSVLQMLCKTYGGCLCFPGSEIPNWFSDQTIGSSISIRVPAFLDGKIGKVLVCVVYAADKEEPRLLDLEGWFDWTFCNKTRNPQESYRTESRNWYFDSFEDHIFVDVMQFHHINVEMKSGDEIELSVNLGELSEVKKCEIQVKKCGIHLLADEPNVIDEDGNALLYHDFD